jgi:hypothetical protein
VRNALQQRGRGTNKSGREKERCVNERGNTNVVMKSPIPERRDPTNHPEKIRGRKPRFVSRGNGMS